MEINGDNILLMQMAADVVVAEHIQEINAGEDKIDELLHYCSVLFCFALYYRCRRMALRNRELHARHDDDTTEM